MVVQGTISKRIGGEARWEKNFVQKKWLRELKMPRMPSMMYYILWESEDYNTATGIAKWKIVRY